MARPASLFFKASNSVVGMFRYETTTKPLGHSNKRGPAGGKSIAKIGLAKSSARSRCRSAIRASRRREYPGGEFFVPCVLVIKRLGEGERHDKAQLNQVLRDHGAST